jgi:hypothetical protein
MSFRETVNLSQFPDLVMILLGMRANSLRAVPAVISFGPRIQKAVDAKPDGLLLHENLFFSLFPLHVGMRQYWRDLAALETWTRESPHLDWWKSFHKDPRGTSFWHEAYFLRGGIDSVYISTDAPVGLQRFAPRIPAHGSISSARMRARPNEASYSEGGSWVSPVGTRIHHAVAFLGFLLLSGDAIAGL